MLFEQIELETDENVILVVRKHWFILFVELLGIAILALAPIIIYIGYFIIPANSVLPAELTGYYPYIIGASTLWWVFCIMTATMIWTHYYLDLWAITDRRIITIQQIGFFNRKVSSFRLERLQDIKVKINGIIATLLNFGSIRAQTASAAEDNFRGTGLPDPRGIQSTIQTAMDKRLQSLHNRPLTNPDI